MRKSTANHGTLWRQDSVYIFSINICYIINWAVWSTFLVPPASTAVHGTPKPRAKPPDSGCRTACVYECDAVTVCPHLSSATNQLGHLEQSTRPPQACCQAPRVCMGPTTQASVVKLVFSLPTHSVFCNSNIYYGFYLLLQKSLEG